MKRLLFVLSFVLSIFQANSQTWQYSETNDPFDGKVIFVKSRGSGGTFPYSNPTFVVRYKEKSDDLEIFITDLGYSGCDDNLIRISFDDNSDNVVGYNVGESVGNDAVFFRSSSFIGLINNLKSYSKMSVRFVNSCDINTFKYSLFGSSAALDKLLNQTKRYNPKAIKERLELAEKRRIQEEKERKEEIRLKNEREEKRKAIEDAKENAVNKEFERLKDSIIANDIPESEITFLKNSIIDALNLEYMLHDKVGSIETIFPKIHTDDFMKSRGRHRAYIKFKDGRQRLVNTHAFSKKSDKEKWNNRIISFNEDIEYLKVSEEYISKLELPIRGQAVNTYGSKVYDTIVAIIPNNSKARERFEELGTIELHFANSKDPNVGKKWILGSFAVEKESPLLKSLYSQVSVLKSFIKPYISEPNWINLVKLKNLLINESINLNNIDEIGLSNKKGKLEKYQFDNGMRQLIVKNNNGKSKSLNVYINLKTKEELIFLNL